MIIKTAGSEHLEAWAELRAELWPRLWLAGHRAEIADHLGASGRVAFVAMEGPRRALGFAEAALRHDYVNGCETSPVAFLEGVYVRPAGRRKAIAQALVAAVEAWAKEQGCAEFASDADLANAESHAFHAAAGFEETERVVFFRKRI